MARWLQQRLAWTYQSIDTYRELGYDWPQLARLVANASGPMLVEGNVLPQPFREVLAQHRSGLLEVVCDETVRLERMQHRPPLHDSWKPKHAWHDKYVVESPLGQVDETSLLEWVRG